MKFAIVALAAAAAVNAELVFDDATGTFKCLGDAAGKNFCAGGSLSSNIIIRCDGENGQPGNCNNNLAGVPPVGVKTSALCWQTSETSGDAGCSFQGTVYADDGSSFPIPGYSASSSSSSAPEPTYGAPEPTYGETTSSAPEPTYGEPTSYAPEPTYGETTSYAPEPTYGATTETSSSYYPTLSWSNTTTTYYPPPTYTVPTSTLITVTGTTTEPAPTTYVPPPTYAPPPPPTNQTSYTSSLPIPTQSPSGAGALLAKDSLVFGVVALIGFMFL